MALTEKAQLFDPIRTYRFTVEINGKIQPYMSVSGLSRYSPSWIELTRGFTGESTLQDWYSEGKEIPREIKVTVDQNVVFTYKGCRPGGMSFSDLDAGGNTIFAETLEVSYETVSVDWKPLSA